MVDVVIAGDFNPYDQLWEGGDVSLERQGEADPIVGLMNELALSSLRYPRHEDMVWWRLCEDHRPSTGI